MTIEANRQLAGSTSHISLMSRPMYGAPRIHLDENAGGGGTYTEPAVFVAPADAPESFSSDRAAGEYLAQTRRKQAAEAGSETQETPAESADEPATAETELSGEDNAAAGEDQPTGETQEADPAANQPPLELPRSWTKEQAEHWKALPRATQEFLTERASKDSEAVRRVQNETAEKLKGLTAKEQLAEQAKLQYEGKLKSVVGVLENEQLRDFPDIRSMADLEKMATDAARLADPNSPDADPFKALQLQGRLAAWRFHQEKLQAAHGELQQADVRKTQAQETAWKEHVQAESKLASEAIPDLADKVKGPALYKRATDRLTELGFTPEEQNDLASGKTKISVFDHRLWQLINSDLKLSDIRKAKTAATKTPVPPVQRPGSPAPRSAAESSTIQALTQKLEKSGDIKDAVALRAAQNRVAQRRAAS
jgi:hypothetical protein